MVFECKVVFKILMVLSNGLAKVTHFMSIATMFIELVFRVVVDATKPAARVSFEAASISMSNVCFELLGRLEELDFRKEPFLVMKAQLTI